MCGIIGYTGIFESREILLKGLKKLEYRGYDSAGIAVLNGGISIIKTRGTIDDLREITPTDLKGRTGIAHTRWATHGEPSERNSHPHLSRTGDLVLVHNGIIENYQELKQRAGISDVDLLSETDSEVLLNLIDGHFQSNGRNLLEALKVSLNGCVGSYALVLFQRESPGELVVCRRGSPLVVGTNESGAFVASDIYAISEYTDTFYFPEEGDIVVLNRNGIKESFNHDLIPRELVPKKYIVDSGSAGKNGHDHFMHKEIHEQPAIATRLLQKGLRIKGLTPELQSRLASTGRITILGCGTSWHAGLVGRYLFERFARIPVNTEYASEYRYRNPVISVNDLIISISQSGETADTLAANRLGRESGALTMGLINVASSTLERETDLQVFLDAGPEIGVASTKAYTSQLLVLSMLTSYFCRLKGLEESSNNLDKAIYTLPAIMDAILKGEESIRQIAEKYHESNNFLFLGRGLNFPSALEGALKLKEISYIHAEGYPGAEMKHGPIALIDHHFPTMAIVTDSENRSKMVSNIREIKARSGKVIAICSGDDNETPGMVDDVICLPEVPDVLSPLVTAIPLQLFSYYVSVQRGCNVDQPRNLAKSVTVE